MKIKKIRYRSKFVKKVRKLPTRIQELAFQKEDIFVKNPHDSRLKTHKLSGKLKNYYSFSINYSYRIVFVFEAKDIVTFIDIGTHSIYQ